MIEPSKISDEVTLRALRQDDAAMLADSYLRNRGHLAPWDPARAAEFFTAAGQDAEIAKQLGAGVAGTSLPLVLAAGGVIIGRVNLSGITHGAFESANLGYWIDERHAGRGLVSAAVQHVTRIARDDLGLHRVEAGTLVHNHASQRVLQKSGFEYFGLAPRYLRIAGRWQDHRLFQLILHD